MALICSAVLLTPAPQVSSPAPMPGVPFLVLPGTEVSLETARQMVPFRVPVPAHLPGSLPYSSVRVDSTSPSGALVYLIYSPGPLPSETTPDALLSQGGLFIVMTPEPGTDPGPVIAAQVLHNGGTEVSIDGSPGVYVGNQIHWWADGIHYALVSPSSETDMVAIAVSMGT